MLPGKRDSSEFVPGHAGSFSLSFANLGNHDDSNTRSSGKCDSSRRAFSGADGWSLGRSLGVRSRDYQIFSDG